jgi:hypothetical protein
LPRTRRRRENTPRSRRRGTALAIATKVSDELRIHEVSGPLETAEIGEVLAEVYASPDFDPEKPVLWDIRQADAGRLSLADVRSLAIHTSDEYGVVGVGRAAILVSQDATFGRARQYQSLVDGQMVREVRVFRDPGEAMIWLGVSAES